MALDAKRYREIAAAIHALKVELVAQESLDNRVLIMYLTDAEQESGYLATVVERTYPTGSKH